VTNRTYDSFVGQIVVGRIESGVVREGQKIFLQGKTQTRPFVVTALSCFAGLGKERVPELEAGNIAFLAGCDDPAIGDTISEDPNLKPLPRLQVDAPTVSVKVSVNTSPFAGQEGKYLTSRKLEEVLVKACMANVALQMEPTATPEVFMLKARGELQIVILLEQLRREGYELMVGRPEIIPIEIDGEMKEALETLIVDVPENMVGRVTEIVSKRGARLEGMENMEVSRRMRLEFAIPARGLIGIRSMLLTETKGEAIFSSSFREYIPYQGKRFSRQNGALVCDRSGVSVEYGLFHLQPRGKLFIREGVKVYEGMIFGENSRDNNLFCNPTKEKKLTNMRAAGSDESTKLKPIKELNLDESLEWIDEDEWVEVTPLTVRIRKQELKTNLASTIRD
jgi:GTP-binding protein